MKNKSNIILIILGIILSLVLGFGLAYSYLAVKVNGLESKSTIVMDTGTLSINYENNSGDIILSKIIPGAEVTKKFTLTGTNDAKANDKAMLKNMYYQIGIVVDKNTFTAGSLTYTLNKDSSSSSNGQMADNVTGYIPNSGTTYIAAGYFAENAKNVTHVYNLTIAFPETYTDQSVNQGATFACHITVTGTVNGTLLNQDSWETIANNIINGNASDYIVGSEKIILMNNKLYTLRLANNSTPTECSRTDFSQSACGFVIEFVDIVEKRSMNSSRTNVGGWPATAMKTYLNGDFYNSLPEELRNVIKDTKVVSGHGSTTGETNFTSTDKIYLLSSHEVYEDGTSNQVSSKDTAYNQTRQLDYYKNLGVTTSSYSGVEKKYNNSISGWWLRAPDSSDSNYFLFVTSSSFWYSYISSNPLGLAPAFRIG